MRNLRKKRELSSVGWRECVCLTGQRIEAAESLGHVARVLDTLKFSIDLERGED